MNNDIRENELLRTSQTVILLSYTAFSVILIGEALLLSWEKWVLILMVIALAIAWTVHIRQAAPERVRLWIYSLMMMAVMMMAQIASLPSRTISLNGSILSRFG